MLSVIIKETREFTRNKVNLFFFLMFPAIMIFLLGQLIENMNKSEETIGSTTVVYAVEADDPYSRLAVNSFLSKAGDGGSIVFEESDDIETARIRAGKDEISAVMVFRGDPLSIDIYEGKNRVKNRAVKALAAGFSQINKAVYSLGRTQDAALVGEFEPRESYIDASYLGGRPMIDYYAVTLPAMIAFMNVITGVACFAGERQHKTIDRLMIAPVRKTKLFLAKILGLLPQTLMQMAVMMSVSVLLFKARYADSLAGNLYLFLMFFLVSFALISIGAAAGIVFKKNIAPLMLSVIWIMMFLAGTYSNGLYIEGVTDVMPAYQIHEAAFDLTIMGKLDRVHWINLACIVIIAVMLVIGAASFKRKEREG